MEQTDTVIEMLSERRAGSKLKRIIKRDCPTPDLSEITFYFEGEEDEERCIGIAGRDLQVSFGRKSI